MFENRTIRRVGIKCTLIYSTQHGYHSSRCPIKVPKSPAVGIRSLHINSSMSSGRNLRDRTLVCRQYCFRRFQYSSILFVQTPVLLLNSLLWFTVSCTKPRLSKQGHKLCPRRIVTTRAQRESTEFSKRYLLYNKYINTIITSTGFH